ncbi:hypothetical protein D0C36_06535 [Mucilaginibacter conchicola]|uniref:Uncharacterized protein n=1 Tax=Mucilaginibacter conchicola TaxID=2303333 RepID=A0A372NYJ2_9SPHI|nr:hypothetical protein [Mucilaginibacter conchicola]RFZ95180.1 hypothetical protein D0C36_06535 [Mucilaginibacter conchicola]
MNNSKAYKIVAKFNRDTKEGKIVWSITREKPSSLSGSENLIDDVFVTQVLEKKLRLYRFQYKSYYDEDIYEWVDKYRLEFVGIWGNSEWTFPYEMPIFDLYESVRYKVSNIDKFMEDFLGDDEGEESSNLNLF